MPIAGDVVGSAGAVILPMRLSADGYRPGLDPTTQARIALALRQMYSDLVDQPIPERFLTLLAQLDRTHAEGS